MRFFKALKNHFITHVVKDQRGIIDPLTLGLIGGGTILGGLSLFGGGKKKEKEDPLAGIRNQLQGLASGVPELIEKRKELIRQLFAEKEAGGLEDIRETFRGERGFGASTLETREGGELRRLLGIGEAGAISEAEMGGLKLQSDILGGVAGLTPGAEPEEPSFGEELLGIGGEIAGREISRIGETKRLETLADILRERK